MRRILILAAIVTSVGQLHAADINLTDQGRAGMPAVSAVTDIGDRLEIFVDRALIDTMENATLALGQPRPEEISMMFQHPWKGACRPPT